MNKNKEREKKIWDSLTEEEKEKINHEKDEIIKWSIEEDEKAMKKIKEDGRYCGGLDGNYPELIEISKETNRKLNELIERVFGRDVTEK